MALQKLKQAYTETPTTFRLVAYVLIVSTAITLLAIALLLVKNYRSGINTMQRDLQQLESLYLPGVTRSLWNFDQSQLDAQLEALQQLPEVSAVSLTWQGWDGNQHSRHLGNIKDNDSAPHVYPLIHHNASGVDQQLGTLTLRTSMAPILAQLGRNALFIGLFQILKVILLVSFILYLAHMMMGRHSRHLLHYMSQLSLANLHKPLTLHRAHKDDEFQEMANAINKMRTSMQRDMNRRRQAELELFDEKEKRNKQESERRQAEAVSKAKSDFLATMSHEIRTPMNGILALLDLLDETQLSNHQRHYIGLMQSSSENLQTVLNDVLDFAKIEAGELSLDKRPLDLEKLIDTAISPFAALARKKEIGLVFDLKLKRSRQFEGDSVRLRQILLNLVNNAIKFTDQGHVLVTASEQSTNQGTQVHIAVTDTGIGIPDDQLDAIFQPFAQNRSQTDRMATGTGLGLTVCRRLVNLMDGDINVSSTPGKGTTFTVTLPCHAEDHETDTPLNGQHWLVLSKDKVLSDALAAMLTDMGADVQHGADLSRLKLADHYHHLLIDHPLLDQARKTDLHRLETHRNKLHLLTYLDEDEETLPMLTKPVSPAMLRKLLNSTAVATQPPQVYEHNRFDHLQVLVAEDNAINRDVIVALLAALDIHPVLCHDGQEAVDVFHTAGGAFDLILMDCEMPVMDGFDATEAIRTIENEANLTPCPVVALTAHVMSDHRKRMEAVGMDHFLGKPVRSKALKNLLIELGLNKPLQVLSFDNNNRHGTD